MPYRPSCGFSSEESDRRLLYHENFGRALLRKQLWQSLYRCVTHLYNQANLLDSCSYLERAGVYEPPSDCTFNRVTFNLTVTAAGRQFDRLGTLYFGDVEVWRTSTAEPTKNGIIWTQIKDMSHMLSVLIRPQQIIFDLPNIVNDIYTAPFNVTLQATYSTAPNRPVQADMIIPISARRSEHGQPSAWQIPSSNASTDFTIPRNTRKAIVTIAATGQIDEEFWFTNVPSDLASTFPQMGALLGYSPFREVQLLIDGQLAGVVWPFPVVFTGGVVPGLWRPIVGVDAFDLREDEIDVTPWLGMLCDGRPHTFEIRVAGLTGQGNGEGIQLTQTVGSYWVVSGKLFLWLDEPGLITSGTYPTIEATPPFVSLVSTVRQDMSGANETLIYGITIARTLNITSALSSKGVPKSRAVTWVQSLNHTSTNTIESGGTTQRTTHLTTFVNESPFRKYTILSIYPLSLNSTFVQHDQGAFDISASLDCGQELWTRGMAVFPEPLDTGQGEIVESSHLATRQNGTASYHSPGRKEGNSTSLGTTEQSMIFKRVSEAANAETHLSERTDAGKNSALYCRHIVASDGLVVKDEELLERSGLNTARVARPLSVYSLRAQYQNDFVDRSVKSLLGKTFDAIELP